ncbi:hypothetical protein [Dactylosporangium sp. NPDC006015]
MLRQGRARAKVLRMLTAAVVMPLVVVLGWGAAAYAGTNRTAGSRGEGVRAIFYHDGEHFFVCDDSTDGLQVYGEYIWNDVNYQKYNALGGGTCYDHNLDFPENRTFMFRACLDYPVLPPPAPGLPGDWCTPWVAAIT